MEEMIQMRAKIWMVGMMRLKVEVVMRNDKGKDIGGMSEWKEALTVSANYRPPALQSEGEEDELSSFMNGSIPSGNK